VNDGFSLRDKLEVLVTIADPHVASAHRTLARVGLRCADLLEQKELGKSPQKGGQ
jgi:hypothetical protein